MTSSVPQRQRGQLTSTSADGETAVNARPLLGRRIVTTRDERGRLDSLLAQAGADVVHVPLIEIAAPDDGGRALDDELGRLDTYRWLVVTSQHGAHRVAGAVAQSPGVSLAAVGSRTADELTRLSGRAPTIVPSRQTAAALVGAMPPPEAGDARLLVVQADRADDTLTAGLTRTGFDVTAVVGYSTRLRSPTSAERRAALEADAVAFASGSAARSWAASFGSVTPAVVVVIGPTTRDVAVEVGLKVTHMAADHSVEGLAAEIASVFEGPP